MKFSGKIGFWEQDAEVSPGVWRPRIVERSYTGDVQKDTRRFMQSNTQNQTFTVNNQISILGDLYAQNNWASIRYVVWKGTKWSVTDVQVTYPRLTLTLGGVYNENQIGSS